MDWFYQNKPVEELPLNSYGFVYKLHLAGGLFYVGKKNCLKKTTLPALKSGLTRPGAERIGKNKDGKRVYFDIVTKASDWREYESSSDDISDHIIIYKEILEFLPTKRSLTYKEEWWQFNLNILEDDSYINKQIGNRYYRNKLL
jgi:hypothetical protein